MLLKINVIGLGKYVKSHSLFTGELEMLGLGHSEDNTYSSGFTEGVRIGKELGYDKGYAEGYDKGLTELIEKEKAKELIDTN